MDAPGGLFPKKRTVTARRRHGTGTRKGTLLESVPLVVTTWTVPVVAPLGTVVLIRDVETTLNTDPGTERCPAVVLTR
jgi:hypothetical protein